MARSSLRIPSAKTMAFAVLATSMLVALFSKRFAGIEEKPHHVASSTGQQSDIRHGASVPLKTGYYGSDFEVLIQGKIHTELGDVEEDNARRISSYEEQIETLSEDAGLPHPVKPRVQPSYASLLAMRIRESAASLVESVRHLAERTKYVSGMPLLLILMISTIVTVISFGILFCLCKSFMGWSFKRGQKNDAQGDMSPPSQRNLGFSPLMATRSLPARSSQVSRPGSTMTLNGTAFETREMRPTSGSFLPDLRTMNSATIVAAPSSCTSLAEVQRVSVRPPPLCPSLVMPMSEVVLGIQMYELAQMGAEGTLNIVGISGKALLRADVKMVGNDRSLGISMPESNGTPQATITPPGEGARAGRATFSRALEIRGMRGTFYGMLQMQSSGACSVVKDGRTVLTIDGDADSLQLALKSATGIELASVRCSTEHFEGVDHLEVRVEPGMDTVLVTAVVLAVLLLSPYLPADD